MTLDEVQRRIDAIVTMLCDKGHKNPCCHLDLKSGGRVSSWTHTTCGSEDEGEHHYADTAEGALKMAEDWAASRKDADTAAKEIAVANLGKAIDGVRAAGFEAGFVNPLAESFQAMTENLLTDQRETS